MSANRNQRTAKPTFRPDWLAAAASASRADGMTEWSRYLTDRHRDERVRKAFNEAHARWESPAIATADWDGDECFMCNGAGRDRWPITERRGIFEHVVGHAENGRPCRACNGHGRQPSMGEVAP